MTLPKKVAKRDGRVVDFDKTRVERALTLCYRDIHAQPQNTTIDKLVDKACNLLRIRFSDKTPTVEQIQDAVEAVLIANDEYDAAKHYIIYRHEHAKLSEVPADIKAAFDEDIPYFPTPLQRFQQLDKYSRWNYDAGHRETWVQTVDRTVDFLHELADGRITDPEFFHDIKKNILTMQAMPSMRLLATAGPAARRNNISLYSCSYMPVSDIQVFVEALLISMSGCGVGYSVESKYVCNLPRVQTQSKHVPAKMIIEDSTEGWAAALERGLTFWFAGEDIEFDYSLIRPAGATLRIKGGRASGPGPLRWLLNFAREKILSRQGNVLRPIDAHDIMCAVGEAAVSGGHRRTAMIALFDPDDVEMRLCKSGANLNGNEHRWNANNSMVFDERIQPVDQAQFAHWFLDMADSQRGEPGIFSRSAAINTIPSRRDPSYALGVNPCGEIYLRPFEFCNLSIAVARADDTFETLREKVKLATRIGTIQSLATNFPGLRNAYKENCEDERLLGVSIAGQMDSAVARDPEVQNILCLVAVSENLKLAKTLNINPSAAVTCVKPDGNSSVLLNTSSGVHARWSPYQIRNVQVQIDSPMHKVLRDSGVPLQARYSPTGETTAVVASFPLKAPDGAIVREQLSAIEQCEYWKQVKTMWTEHNPSCFTGEQRFITKQGLRTFSSYSDGSVLEVLGSDGLFRPAVMHHLGEQRIFELIVERSNIRHTIRTTASHLWPITSGNRRFIDSARCYLHTDELINIKDAKNYKLETVNPKFTVRADQIGVLHGIVFGDGSKHYNKPNSSCFITLCNDPKGADSRILAELFRKAGYKPIEHEDRQQVCIYGLPSSWKDLPGFDASDEYIKGFITGWFAADGSITKSGGTATISSTHKTALEWLQTIAPRVGLATSTHIKEEHSVSGVAPCTSYALSFVKKTLDPDFFILDKTNKPTTTRATKYWKIIDVRQTDSIEPVYCVETDGDRLFVLEGNILTHNCTIYYDQNELLELMKWVYENRAIIGGMSFLPNSDVQYEQMPNVEISEEEFNKLISSFPDIDWSKLYAYEHEDQTEAAQTLACVSGACELTF